MPASAIPDPSTATTVPNQWPNGSASSPPVPAPPEPAPLVPPTRTSAARPGPAWAGPQSSRHSRIASVRIALITGFVALIVLVIFIAQNTRPTRVNFLGAHAGLSLAVALLISATAGGLLMAAAGTARITQLRLTMRRLSRRPGNRGGQRARGPRSPIPGIRASRYPAGKSEWSPP